ncbi:MAG TPA: NAD(P)H-dependent oxidoreductase subunit E, partial [Flavisolibacter sp.]
MKDDLPAIPTQLYEAGSNKPIEPPQAQMLNKLWALQKRQGYISDEAIGEIATEFNITRIEVEGVTSFYHFFHRHPTGKFTIYLNNSIVSDFKGFQR